MCFVRSSVFTVIYSGADWDPVFRPCFCSRAIAFCISQPTAPRRAQYFRTSDLENAWTWHFSVAIALPIWFATSPCFDVMVGIGASLFMAGTVDILRFAYPPWNFSTKLLGSWTATNCLFCFGFWYGHSGSGSRVFVERTCFRRETCFWNFTLDFCRDDDVLKVVRLEVLHLTVVEKILG